MMPQVVLLLVVIAALGILGAEAILHRRVLRRLRLRIHVNGTRGKSTVTRLIAAGLRAGGLRVVAKTTGTAARIILEDGSDLAIVRPGRPTITEQRRFLAWAARRGVDAVVVECMAVGPEYQRASEDYLLRSHVGVITNVRLDHGEVLGPDPRTAARAFAAAVPRDGTVIVAEPSFRHLIEEGARRRGCRVVTVAPEPIDGELVPDGELFPENVALAVEACRLAGVDPAIARQGMRDARPDPGAVSVRQVDVRGVAVTWVNAFAANDPESARLILRRVLSPSQRPLVVIYNHRDDRPLRTRAFAPLLAEMAPVRVLVVGDHPRRVARWLARAGIRATASQTRVGAEVFRTAAAEVGDRGIVLGLGNIAGIGMELARWEQGGADD